MNAMTQKKILQLMSVGNKQIDMAQALILSENQEDLGKLITLREWFYYNADSIKNSLHNDMNLNQEKRQMLEKLISVYTVAIVEIDEKIDQADLLEAI